MERPDGAARNRDIVRAAASEHAKRFGRNCRERRADLSMSLAELSERSGVGASHLSRLENGQGNPTLEVMGSIAAALRASVVELLGG